MAALHRSIAPPDEPALKSLSVARIADRRSVTAFGELLHGGGECRHSAGLYSHTDCVSPR